MSAAVILPETCDMNSGNRIPSSCASTMGLSCRRRPALIFCDDFQIRCHIKRKKLMLPILSFVRNDSSQRREFFVTNPEFDVTISKYDIPKEVSHRRSVDLQQCTYTPDVACGEDIQCHGYLQFYYLHFREGFIFICTVRLTDTSHYVLVRYDDVSLRQP